MWTRQIAGRTLTFHLAGINNQNFLMRDDQTGSYWQQITGKAVAGPLKGSTLTLIPSDDLTFALWRSEEPNGSVLKPVAQFAKDYEKKDWEKRYAKARTVISFPKTGIPARELMLGVREFGVSRAYPMKRILDEKLIKDHLGGKPVIVVLGPDNTSVRIFRNYVPDATYEPDFYRYIDARYKSDPARMPLLTDAATGSEWNFQGCAVSGPAQGNCLEQIPAIKDYWFDWRNYHPGTTVFEK